MARCRIPAICKRLLIYISFQYVFTDDDQVLQKTLTFLILPFTVVLIHALVSVKMSFTFLLLLLPLLTAWLSSPQVTMIEVTRRNANTYAHE